MASVAASLASILPAPKLSSADEVVVGPTRPTSTRILGGGEEAQLVIKKSGPPPYGKRSSWRPRSAEDFGDGGAFPEIPIAQYPLDMGRKGSSSLQSKALSLQVDSEGRVKYDAIARQGHDEKRIIHASFRDLIPLRQRADIGEISLERPNEEEIKAQAERTRTALAALVEGAVAAQRPKIVKTSRKEPTYVRYTPSNHMGDNSKKNERIIKIVEKHVDPMEPPKFKHKKIPRGPPSPPAPVMHSPPRKLTAADQEAWTIPPPISNWKNPKGYTVPLDKRLAADGRGLQDVTISDKFAQLSEALFMADRHAREEVRQRSLMQQKLAEKEKAQKEEHLRQLAQKARESHAARIASKARSTHSPSSDRDTRSRSRSHSTSRSAPSRSPTPSSDEEAAREREKLRRERKAERERELRMKRMGKERRLEQLAREQNRDISEKVALGIAKPTASASGMYDSRLFSQTSAFNSGFNEDQIYDKPLFAAAEAASHIYRPRVNTDFEDSEEAAQGELEKFKRESRFDVLGKAQKGFKGAADMEQRDGPVQFEKAISGDVYGLDQFLQEVEAGAKGKKHGLQLPDEPNESKVGGSKRPRVDDEDDY